MVKKPNRIKTFIYFIYNKIKYWIDLIGQVVIDEDGNYLFNGKNLSTVDKNPYLKFFDWLLEILQYGITFAIVLTLFTGFNVYRLLVYTVAFGLLRWWILSFIMDTSKVIRGK